MNIKKNIIYALTDEDGSIRYIGKSVTGIKRAKEHFKPSQLVPVNHKTNWIKHVKSQGRLPKIIILQELENKADLFQAEINAIAYHRSIGANLTNSTDGGEGALGRVCSPETLERMSNSRKGKSSTIVNKKPTFVIDGVDHRECPGCVEFKPLSNFIWVEKRRAYYTYCRACKKEKTRAQRIKNPPKKLSKEEVQQSYITRQSKITESLIKFYKDNDVAKSKLAKHRSKPIQATNYITGEILKFPSAKLATGFDAVNIGKAIKNKTLYKDYYWSFLST